MMTKNGSQTTKADVTKKRPTSTQKISSYPSAETKTDGYDYPGHHILQLFLFHCFYLDDFVVFNYFLILNYYQDCFNNVNKDEINILEAKSDGNETQIQDLITDDKKTGQYSIELIS